MSAGATIFGGCWNRWTVGCISTRSVGAQRGTTRFSNHSCRLENGILRFQAEQWKALHESSFTTQLKICVVLNFKSFTSYKLVRFWIETFAVKSVCDYFLKCFIHFSGFARLLDNYDNFISSFRPRFHTTLVCQNQLKGTLKWNGHYTQSALGRCEKENE